MILVVDVGTSSTKFLVMDELGVVRYTHSEKYCLLYPTPGAVTMDITSYTAHLNSGLTAIGTYCTSHGITLQGVSVTSQRSSVIAVARDGRPLSHALMWQDTRSQAICDRFEEEMEQIRAISGMIVAPIYSAPKMAYVRETMPDTYHAAEKLVGFCEYTLYQLTSTWATDTSIASRTSLFDITALSWSDELLTLFGIDDHKLCPLIEVGSKVGMTTSFTTRILGQREPVPVFSAGGDQQCAALGNGALKDGDICANFGSGAYVLGLANHPTIPRHGSVVCNASAIAGKWQIESSFSSCGMSLDWIDRLLFKTEEEPAPYTNFMAASRRAPIGSNGIRFSIHLAGKKGERGSVTSLGNIFNITNSTTKDDLARSVLEGIASAYAESLALVHSELDVEATEVMISGGLTKDRFFNQMTSSLSGLGALTLDNPEATATGAWISTATRLGLYASEASAFEAMAGQLSRSRYIPIEDDRLVYRTVSHELHQLIDAITKQ